MRVGQTPWTHESSLDFTESKTRTVHHSSFKTLPSPYTTPAAIRAVLFAEPDARAIELRYLSEEPVLSGSYAGGVEIEFGRRTLRPTMIKVPLDKRASVTQLISAVDRALDSFVRVNLARPELSSHFAREVMVKMTIDSIRQMMRRYQSQLSDFTEK
jgi:hypothetical protein